MVENAPVAETSLGVAFPTGVGDNSLISLDFMEESGFGFRSVQLGFRSVSLGFRSAGFGIPSARLGIRSGRAGRGRPGADFRSPRERGDSFPDGERAPGSSDLGDTSQFGNSRAALEKAGFAEGKSLDFRSLFFGFPSSFFGISFQILWKYFTTSHRLNSGGSRHDAVREA